MKHSHKLVTETLFQGKKYDDLDALIKIRKAIGPARFYTMVDGKKTPLSSALFGIYTRLSNILDQTIADNLGGTLVKNTKGRGVVADVITDSGFVEAKAISTTTDQEGKVTRSRGIGIAGGKGLKLQAGRKALQTGVSRKETVQFTDDFIGQLVAAKDNQKKLKDIMNGKSRAAIALRKNFMLKSGDIRVPIEVGNKKVLKAIRFTWNDVRKNKFAKIKITVDKKGDVFFNIFFTPSVVRDALNKANKAQEIELKKVSEQVAKALAEEFASFSPQVLAFLEKNTLVQTIEVDKGSALIGKGTIKRKKSKSSASQQFISSAQLTTMLFKKLGEKMPRGPLRGPPLSPVVLTERTGRFRRSARVVPNYRRNLMNYFYDPLYGVHRDTDRNPDELIEKSIREIVVQLFSRQFNIVRGF